MFLQSKNLIKNCSKFSCENLLPKDFLKTEYFYKQVVCERDNLFQPKKNKRETGA